MPIDSEVPSPVMMTQPEPEPKRTIIKMANGTEIDLNSIKVKKDRLRDYNYFGSVAMIATHRLCYSLCSYPTLWIKSDRDN